MSDKRALMIKERCFNKRKNMKKKMNMKVLIIYCKEKLQFRSSIFVNIYRYVSLLINTRNDRKKTRESN